MAGLPKKYAKMGFKKGWRLFKASKTKTKRKTQKVKTMAKKRRTTKKAKSLSKGEKVLRGLVPVGFALGYGFIRDKASDLLNNLLDKTPLGSALPASRITDEVVMLGTGFALGKSGLNKNYYGRKAIQISRHIELGRIGEEFSDMQQSKKQSTNTQSSSWN